MVCGVSFFEGYNLAGTHLSCLCLPPASPQVPDGRRFLVLAFLSEDVLDSSKHHIGGVFRHLSQPLQKHNSVRGMHGKSHQNDACPSNHFLTCAYILVPSLSLVLDSSALRFF